jgi:hypothetical protein
MATHNRNDHDTTTKSKSPNTSPLKKSRPASNAAGTETIESQLDPQQLDKKFTVMRVDDSIGTSTPTVAVQPFLSMIFIDVTINKSNAYYWNHKIMAATAMSPAEIFGDGKETFHHLNRHSKTRAKLPVRANMTVPLYTDIFQSSFSSKTKDAAAKAANSEIKLLAIRLSLADPVELFVGPAYWTPDSQLVPGDLACAWIAAYDLFGAPWNVNEKIRPVFLAAPKLNMSAPTTKDPDRMDTTPSDTTPPVPPPVARKKSASFGPLPSEAVKNPYKLVKGLRQMATPAKDLTTKLKVTQITFLTVFLPRLRGKSSLEQSKEISSLLEIFMAHVTKADSKAAWLAWQDSDILRNPPITKSRMAIPSTRAALLEYTEEGAYTHEGQSLILLVIG